MTVIMGIDPHKASHAAVAIGYDEHPLAEIDSAGTTDSQRAERSRPMSRR